MFDYSEFDMSAIYTPYEAYSTIVDRELWRCGSDADRTLVVAYTGPDGLPETAYPPVAVYIPYSEDGSSLEAYVAAQPCVLYYRFLTLLNKAGYTVHPLPGSVERIEDVGGELPKWYR